MSRVFKRGSAGAVDFNMTPMIDVTFQLILFFILAGSFASEVLAKIEVPRPVASQAEDPDKTVGVEAIIVNVVSKATVGDESIDPYVAGRVDRYIISGKEILPAGAIGEIKSAIEDALKKVPAKDRKDVLLVVRADRRVHFGGVQPVLAAAVLAGVTKMRITAELVKVGG